MLCSARRPQNQRVPWVHKEVGVNYVLYRRLPKHLTYRMLSGDNEHHFILEKDGVILICQV